MRLVGSGGTVFINDEKADETSVPPGSDHQRMLYGFSILHCLPVGMGDPSSAQTGAVMRPETFRGYAADAGFTNVEILPVDHGAF